MANADRPRGFTPVRHLNGGSWNNALAVRCMPDDTDFGAATIDWAIGIGTPVLATDEAASATSGPLSQLISVRPLVDEDVTVGVYGVVVGIGAAANGDTLNQETGPWDADDLTRNHVLSTEVEADPDGFVLYVAPAKGWVFEVQHDGTGTFQPGDTMSVSAADDEVQQVNLTTGISNLEVGTGDEAQFRVMEVPEYVDNDGTLANARLHGVFVDPWPVIESQ